MDIRLLTVSCFCGASFRYVEPALDWHAGTSNSWDWTRYEVTFQDESSYDFVCIPARGRQVLIDCQNPPDNDITLQTGGDIIVLPRLAWAKAQPGFRWNLVAARNLVYSCAGTVQVCMNGRVQGTLQLRFQPLYRRVQVAYGAARGSSELLRPQVTKGTIRARWHSGGS